MKNEKPVATNNGSILRTVNELTMKNNTTNKYIFQYECSFCLRELPDGGFRFDGMGACLRCYRLAHQFIDSLRTHEANYFNNLGVRK